MRELRVHGRVAKDSKLVKLQPYLEPGSGLMRISSRLEKADFLSHDQKHNIILCKYNHSKLVERLVASAHIDCKHGGSDSTNYFLKQRIHVLDGKKAAIELIKKCVRCRIFNAHSYSPMIGQIPKERLAPGTCFEFIALDNLGPISIWENGQEQKCYVTLFNDCVSRGVHFELALGADTDNFIDAMRRYIGRRSAPRVVYLDNQRSFVKGAKQIDELYKNVDWKKVTESRKLPNGIEFKFTPAKAPNFNGISERLVGVLKSCLRKVLNKNDKLNSWQLYSILCEIECTLNRRHL
jgi:hypothetical protein